MLRFLASTLVAAPVLGLLAPSSTLALTLGTGDTAGVYYPIGQEVCALYTQSTGGACEALSTGGSLYNMEAVRTGDLTLGIVQSDVQYAAAKGRPPFEDIGPDASIRAVFSLHAEAFTVVAQSAEIEHFSDLRGQRVNVGNPGSGHRATLDALLEAGGQSESFFSIASELKPEAMSRLMCEGRLDAFVYVVGHPSKAIDQATRRCEAHLVDVDGEAVTQLLSKAPYYDTAVVPGGLYAGNPTDTQTFGVRATLVTRADADENQIYDLVSAVFDNWEVFRGSHPALQNLTPEIMIDSARTAPLHAGARRYYQSLQ
ncbi:TAXI family TRAP transporter solute-binding subunit [Salinicola aestuarinus]|uniref:TAXI family TRAP transporter solute-binding subunit n=1 Tax=Salinicola aestuarinus TaxID=1949082 RepID=UPI000DA1A1C4|nr:TAXI family TRAP transporter solute-binding subunit [Salinicola aestuarinus]